MFHDRKYAIILCFLVISLSGTLIYMSINQYEAIDELRFEVEQLDSHLHEVLGYPNEQWCDHCIEDQDSIEDSDSIDHSH